MGLQKWLKNKIKAHDLYATPVSLMFKGQPNLKTPYGGLISLIIKLTLITTACLLIRVIFVKSNTTKSINKIVYDLSNQQTKHYIGQSTFKIAIGFNSLDGTMLDSQILDGTYFSVIATMTHAQWVNNTVQYSYEPIEYGY